VSSRFDPGEYWQTRLAANYNLQGVGYAGLGKAYNAWLYRLRRAVFLQTVRRLGLDLPALSVMDIGSGTGFYIACWLELGVRDLSGVDIAPTAVERLSQAYPQLKFAQADVTRGLGPFQGRRYDLISAFDILFHIVEDAAYEQALGQIAAALQPGGRLIFSENFLHGPRNVGEHQVSRRLDEIAAMLQAAGLEILARRPMFYWMNAPFDSNSLVLKLYRKTLVRLVSHSEAAGTVLGALLYPLERLALSLAQEGPSTEIMVCRKRPDGPAAGERLG
jgi:SAM-dependent methyltransferase